MVVVVGLVVVVLGNVVWVVVDAQLVEVVPKGVSSLVVCVTVTSTVEMGVCCLVGGLEFGNCSKVSLIDNGSFFVAKCPVSSKVGSNLLPDFRVDVDGIVLDGVVCIVPGFPVGMADGSSFACAGGSPITALDVG